MATSSCPAATTPLERCTSGGRFAGLAPGTQCLAESSGACGLNPLLANCFFLRSVYEVLNCEVIYPPSPPPSPPSPPSLPPPPCGADECDNDGACGVCLKLLDTFIECAPHSLAVPQPCPTDAVAAAALQPGDCKGYTTNCGIAQNVDNCPAGPVELAFAAVSGGIASRQTIYNIVDCLLP
jgi:hypothetical protein